ncbi:MAG: tetratricopeptide repeat protein [Pusillimonas sp.]|nr:tetratricopeptide repeat protein [Pusillimonas sp.]
MLYKLLVAEFAGQRGEIGVATDLFYELARTTSDPRLAKRAFQYAMVSRNFPKANRAAQLWALIAPNDPEAVASSLAMSASNGETEGLADALWKRIESAQDKEVAIGQAVAIVSKLNDRAAAYDILRSALREPVQDLPVTWLALADTAWAAGDPGRALAHAERAQQIDPASEPAAQRILEYGLKVDPDAAIAAAQRYLERYPQADDLGLLLVRRLTEAGRVDQALMQVKAMREAAPENFDLLYTEAEVNARSERYEQAKALLNEYIAVQMQRRESIEDKASNAIADASDARLMLVRIAERQGNFDEAIEQLGLIDDPSLIFQSQIHKAVLYGRVGKLDDAREVINTISPQDDQERTVIALTQASIYKNAGRTDLAVDVLEKADKALPDTPEIKYDLGMLYERQGNYDAFEQMMRRIIELTPDDANAYNSLGYTYVDQNRQLDEAQALLEKALQLEPDNPYILDSVGWYFYRTGDYESALQYLRRSFEILPEAEVAAHLGEVLWVMGRKDEAREVWMQGKQQDANNETLRKAMERLGAD